MKIVKIIIGILASLFVLLHLASIPQAVQTIQGEMAISQWIGKIVAIIVGVLVAIWAFRTKKDEAGTTKSE